MYRPLALALTCSALSFAAVASAQTTLVDANGVVFGRVVSFGPVWAWMDNGPAQAMVSFGGNGNSVGLDFIAVANVSVYFPSHDCTGTAYILNQAPGAPPSTLVLSKQRYLLYVADLPATPMTISYNSNIGNGACHTHSEPDTVLAFKASAAPLPLRQFYTAPFSLR